jgi:hypothetical protein
MSAYLSYMKAFGTDLRQVAVWEPGNKIELGDYGEVQDRRWVRLGSIWDLINDQKLRDSRTSTLEQLSLGSAQIVSGNSNNTIEGTSGKLGLTIKFSSDQSVFVRANNCKTRSLNSLQAIANNLAATGSWKKQWTFVNEIRSADTFLVLVGSGSSGEINVTAETSDLLDEFVGGRLSTSNGIQISGSEILQFLGRSGPIHMSLIKVSGPGIFNKGVKAVNVDFAEGSVSAQDKIVFIEDVDSQEFYNQISQ